MLIAMGVAAPGCWTGSTPTPPVTPPVAPKATSFEASACPRDTIPETVCGERRETARACGHKASNLSTVEESKLHITDEDSDNPSVAYRDFVFDRDETHRFRENADDQDTKNNYCCYSQCTPMTVGTADPAALPNGYSMDTRCMPAPPNGTSRPAKADPSCAEGVAIDGVIRAYASTEEGECCYSVPMRHIHLQPIPGRALRVDGVPVVADVGRSRRDGWSADIAPAIDLDPGVRARLAAAWLAIAQLEHASVAAFAALSLRLIAAGAPPSLIAAAHEAALDEVRHAQIAFGLASVYGNEQVGPGRFDVARRASTDGDLRALAIETFLDGCINEAAAAHQAEVASDSARDPVIAAALAEIAEDEARHAALAWSIVAWCVRQGAIDVAALAALAKSAHDGIVAGSVLGLHDEDLGSHGVLGAPAVATIHRDVLREVIEPCLAALAA